MKRTIFIGDVHGCYDELMSLCEHMKVVDEDDLYFVGDLINKGPKSLEVVEFVRNRPNTWCVLGNHEYFPLVDEATYKAILDTGGHMSQARIHWIREQYEKTKELRDILIQKDHRDWLLSLPHVIEKEGFILVHGGLHPEYGIDTPLQKAILMRLHNGKPWYDFYTGSKLVIYGHWAAEGLRVRHNTIGLDTGCCFGGALTGYCLETNEFWQVRANVVYKEPTHWVNRYGFSPENE